MNYKTFVNLLLVVSLGFIVPNHILAQQQAEYCAFKVVVKQPDGRPSVGASVAGQQDGKPFAKTLTDEEGVARLCDAPQGLSEILVGGNRCGAVSVKYLRQLWMKTRQVAVTYENCSGEEWNIANSCLLTIRVRDERGSPAVGVELKIPNDQPVPMFETRISDSFGRIFCIVKYGDTLEGILAKNGLVPNRISERCQTGQSQNLDRTVVLSPSGRNVF